MAQGMEAQMNPKRTRKVFNLEYYPISREKTSKLSLKTKYSFKRNKNLKNELAATLNT